MKTGFNAIVMLGMALILAAPIGNTARAAGDNSEEVTLTGIMPHWQTLLAHDTWTNAVPVATLVTEIEGADNGKAFLDMFGGVRKVNYEKHDHLGRKAGVLVLGAITGGIVAAACYQGRQHSSGQECDFFSGKPEFKLSGFTTGFCEFELKDNGGVYYFEGKSLRSQDKGKKFKVFFDAR